ncbi:DEAD/DEAH box helicase [Cytobacillus praedii]|uniref:DEAD/DEAH box helicase n=1 Tax=Cytobacillus praedii TaxID=1742358 RepID=UPI003AF5230F
MFFFKKKQKEMKVDLTPREEGVEIKFHVIEGKDKNVLSLPLNKGEIEELYKIPGFLRYVAWEELYESEILNRNLLKYDDIYKLNQDEDGRDVLQQLGIPIEEMQVKGELTLDSLPDEAMLNLTLYNSEGKLLDRMGQQYGGLLKTNDNLFLLPASVYSLKKAIHSEFESGYQKVGICQDLAVHAGISLENFLKKETFHLVDKYDLDVKVHNFDHIELVPTGSTEIETQLLNSTSPIGTVKDGLKRDRYVKTKQVHEDVQKILTTKHIKGDKVPLFLDNPSAIMPEHDYTFDLDAFSERVRGLIPIERVRPTFTDGTGYRWFEESGNDSSYDTDFLKGLMEIYPNQQYVEYDGKWIYLDPTLRKKILEIEEDEENKIKLQYALDIKDNEDELDYVVDGNKTNEIKQFPIPRNLLATLFPHQEEGFQWLCHLEEKGIGGLLADDMGLGKTIQVITFLLHQKKRNKVKPTLVVLPIALIENWVEEVNKFAPSLSHSLYIHKGSSRLRSSDLISRYDIIFTSYDTLKIDQLLLGKIKFQTIICDEAQNAKSHSSQRSRALRAMQSEFRLAMTGTPVENSLEELWSIMDFVQPGEIGSLRDFRQKYIQTENFEGLLDKIKPFYLRRTKKEVLADKLPAKHEDKVSYVPASSTQKMIVESMITTKESGQIAILNMLMRLRQLYGHPGVIIQQFESLDTKEIPKLEKLMEIIDNVRNRDEKILIFTEFRKLHSILKRLFMQKYGISVPVIDGDTKNRQGVVKIFNETPGFGILLLSQKAAGVGLTITSANHVVHYTRWWNPAVENQATDRAYRIGQTKDVFVYQIITIDKENFPNGTVEELMHQLLEDKRELAENVIIPFSTKEIQQMVYEKMGILK